MSFLPLQPCCVAHPGELPGTPRGTMQAPEGSRTVLRYVAQPGGGVKDPKAAVVLLYDIMGFKAINPKIIADQYADRLGIPVFVPDYIPNPPDPVWFEPITETYPNEFKDKSWARTIMDFAGLVPKIIWKIPGLFQGSMQPVVRKAIEEVRAEGYERVGAIGFCRGGTMTTWLLSHGDASIIDCGVVCHPEPDAPACRKITKPSLWHLASHDMVYKEHHIEQLKEAMDRPGVVFEHKVYEQTLHGFCARPYLKQEASVKAFNEANEASLQFFKEHLALKE